HLEALEDRSVPSTAGFLDPSFGAPNGYVLTNPNPSSSLRQSAGFGTVVQPDGKIVVAGSAPNSKGHTSLPLLRYNPDGTLDSTFGSGGLVLTTLGRLSPGSGLVSSWHGIALQPDGKIVVAGRHLLSTSPGSLGYDYEWVIGRYNANGTLDTTFG